MPALFLRIFWIIFLSVIGVIVALTDWYYRSKRGIHAFRRFPLRHSFAWILTFVTFDIERGERTQHDEDISALLDDVLHILHLRKRIWLMVDFNVGRKLFQVLDNVDKFCMQLRFWSRAVMACTIDCFDLFPYSGSVRIL